MLNRRTFIKELSFATGALCLQHHFQELYSDYLSVEKLVILHTNDTHSRLDPFPMDGGRNQGLGGVAARAALIEKIRAEEPNVLLLDAGDIFQGTPYFNIYKGEPELKAMSAMQYDACTLGNHDFDGGIDNLAYQLSKHARFSVLVANYDFSGTPMEYKTRPYQIFKKGKLKIGIFGIGIEPKGLIPENLFGNTRYLEPIQISNEMAYRLRKKENCDLIICLSHLGYRYQDNKISDEVLARETENIDVIIGGHTHTFMDEPQKLKNKKGQDVIINQVGWAGIILGRMDFEFNKISGKKLVKNQNLSVSQKTGL
ncbi:MAG: metallophosphatase [Chitinophagaceae bacterium]|nr:metallophosphatase [Chitinophagaceae bacterium]